MRIYDHPAPSSPVVFAPISNRIRHYSRSTADPDQQIPRDVDAVADTSRIIWDAVISDHSGEEVQAVEASKNIDTPAERELQAAQSKDRSREAEEKMVQGKRLDLELHQRLAEKQLRSSSRKRKTKTEK